MRKLDPNRVKRQRHGMTATPTYVAWDSMLQRCTNPNSDNWRHYGGRGIGVCERWLCFANFLADMGERPDGTSIDRINNDGNYEPGNTRWATRREQAMNNRLVFRRREARQKAADMAAAGFDNRTIANRLGVSLRTVITAKHQAGLPVRDMGNRTNHKRGKRNGSTQTS